MGSASVTDRRLPDLHFQDGKVTLLSIEIQMVRRRVSWRDISLNKEISGAFMASCKIQNYPKMTNQGDVTVL